MKISLKLLETDQQISLKIANALLPDIRKYMSASMEKIKKGLPLILNASIMSTPEYSSLISGELRYELGIPNAESKIAGLIDVWSKNIYVVYTPPAVIAGGKIKTQFSVSMVKVDFSDVLYSSYAELKYSSKKNALPWLEWLLLRGSVPIIKEHEIVIGPNRRSRTGLAVMKQKDGQTWSVPKRYSGTIGDNWITRAIDSSNSEILGFIQKAIQL